MFDKQNSLFPVKNKTIYLNHCGVSPLYSGALQREQEFIQDHGELGINVFKTHKNILGRFHRTGGALLNTDPKNISFTTNTAEGINHIANGYSFEPGDQIISYIHEYPSNHYPWVLQKQRGVELILLPNKASSDPTSKERPYSWSMEDLEKLLTKRTKIIALSHVQFTSGFAADLEQLGKFAKSHGIDLIIDAAQSLGCLPIYPEQYGISAIASSGWKWLLGPIGSGILFTSPELRNKLAHTTVGPGIMKQLDDFLDHTWNPFEDGRRFEYSTVPCSMLVGLEKAIADLPLRYGVENINQEIFRLQDLILTLIDRNKYTPLIFPNNNRSGIISFIVKGNPEEIVSSALKQGVTCGTRGGYFRLAPHFYNTEEEIEKAISILNSI